MRITVNGDWTNAGDDRRDVHVFSVTDPIPQFTTQGKIVSRADAGFPVTVPAGVSVAEFRAGWREDWGTTRRNDIDLILVGPNGTLDLRGRDAEQPRGGRGDNPAPGQLACCWWTGSRSRRGTDKFELRVASTARS